MRLEREAGAQLSRALETQLKGFQALSKPLKVFPCKGMPLSAQCFLKDQHEYYVAKGVEKIVLGDQWAV